MDHVSSGDASSATVSIEIFEAEADPQRLDVLTRNLRDELLQAPVDSVGSPPGPPPPEGSRALSVAAAGALVVVLKGSAELVRQVVDIVRGWRQRDAENRSLKITLGDSTLELTNIDAAQQQRLIDEFVRRAMAGG